MLVKNTRFSFATAVLWAASLLAPCSAENAKPVATERPTAAEESKAQETSSTAPLNLVERQPLTLELLDMLRGKWKFLHPLGKSLTFEGSVEGYFFIDPSATELQLGYLCADPEYPDNPNFGEVKSCGTVPNSQASTFQIKEPYFQAHVLIEPQGNGVFRCVLSKILLGPAKSGKNYLSSLWISTGKDRHSIWLSPDSSGDSLLKLTTRRIGHIFDETEPVEVLIETAGKFGTPPRIKFDIEATDYATGETVWTGEQEVEIRQDQRSVHPLTIPLKKNGIFTVTARNGGDASALRICRIPQARKIKDPYLSTIGMGIFQQQIWWFAYQAPLLAKAGVHWIRPWLDTENTWTTIEPQEGKWDTRALDSAVRRMEKFGQEYEFVLYGVPTWVSEKWGRRLPLQHLPEWNRYVEKVVTQYKGKIKHFEIWNEPDSKQFEIQVNDGDADAGLDGAQWYSKLAEATAKTIRKANPDAVVDGISHAGIRDWMERFSKLDGKKSLDVVTLHSYHAPNRFLNEFKERLEVLNADQFDFDCWINEFGIAAFDFNPEFNSKYNTSEKRQAAVLMINYAQALAVCPNGNGKAFWFCSLDPRDTAEMKWDCHVGVLYQGYLPKLSYVALAAAARQLDARKCISRVGTGFLNYVAFEGDIAVVWSESVGMSHIKATEAGCLDREHITVYDVYGNPLASGLAGDISLNLTVGPVYIEGSAEMTRLAEAEKSVRLANERLMLQPGTSAETILRMPEGSNAEILFRDTPADVQLSQNNNSATITVFAPKTVKRASGTVTLAVTHSDGQKVIKPLNVEIGSPNLVRGGAFSTAKMDEWAVERNNSFRWTDVEYHSPPGSLVVTTPFDGRIRQTITGINPMNAINFSCWVKYPKITGNLKMKLACLDMNGGWIGDITLATTDLTDIVVGANYNPVKLPEKTEGWMQIATRIPAEQLPEGVASFLAFFLDVKGDSEGLVYIDDIDLWQ